MATGPGVHSFGPMIRCVLGVLVGAVALLGCGNADRCESDCPNVAGVFQLDSTTATNSCLFTPWLFGPNVELVQTANTSGVRTTLIDPVNQLPVSLAGQVLRPDEPGVGAFEMRTQTSRQRTKQDRELATFQLFFSGSVSRDGDRARLNATLTMTELATDNAPDCQNVLQVVGREASSGSSSQ